MLPPFSSLQIHSTHRLDACVVRIEGELDLAGRTVLERALLDSEQSPAATTFLDLDKLSFMDAGGLSILVEAERRSAANGRWLRMTRGRGQVARLFRLTALDTKLHFADRVPGELQPERAGEKPIPNAVAHA